MNTDPPAPLLVPELPVARPADSDSDPPAPLED